MNEHAPAHDGENANPTVADEKEEKKEEEEIEGYEHQPKLGGLEGYPLDALAIRSEKRTTEDVIRRIKEGRFILNPDFQRGFVWKKDKQSRLIESVLMRIPLPVFYVAEDKEGNLIVVDGLQRLTTLLHFLDDDLKLQLKDHPELNKKTFADLEPRLQNRVQDCQLHFYIIEHSVKERARLDIFERVNGGEVLTRQQMRNAIYNGPATQFLRKHAESPLFTETTGNSLNTKTMRDREFVNRFCSFTLLELTDYKGDMDEWLAESLIKMKDMEEAGLAALGQRFERSLRNNKAVFGKHAFRKHEKSWLDEWRRNNINASLYDVMVTGLADVSENTVISRADSLREAFFALLDDETFDKAITLGTNGTKQVQLRFKMAKEMFKKVFPEQASHA